MVYFYFNSITELCEKLLTQKGGKKNIRECIRNQYVFQYNGGRYIISLTRTPEIIPNFNNPFNLVCIRLEMNRRGYEVTRDTNRKDICEMLQFSLDSTKEEICENLGIPYVKTGVGDPRREKIPILLTNINDPTHIIVFESIQKTGRELNIRPDKVYTYINDQSLSVDYFGEMFKLSFVF